MAGKKIFSVLMFLLLPLLATQAFAAVKTVTLEEVAALVAQNPEAGGYFLVDSRPENKYFEGHIPWAYSIPWQEMKDRLDEFPAGKNTPLVFYCGGVKCDLSLKAAELALAKGYTDVAVFTEGEPAWKKGGTPLWVATNYLKMLLNDRERVALVVDTRPGNKYNEGTVPGALSIPFPEFDQRQGLLPRDLNAQIIFFCGGLKCDLSHKSAEKAKMLGYADVRVYAEGWPAWKEKSTRAFAMVDPKNNGSAPAMAEAVITEGEIGKGDFLQLLKDKPANLILVDVRPTEDFAKGHIPGAINILDEKVGEHAAEWKGKNVVFYCNTGSRSAVAYYAAKDAGIEGRFMGREIDIKQDGSFVIK